MQFERIDAKHNDLSVIREFLRKSGLGLDAQIDYFIVGYHDSGDMAVCGGLAGNIIKCVAIDESLRGDGIALKLATELVNLAYELKRPHLFYLYQTRIRTAI